MIRSLLIAGAIGVLVAGSAGAADMSVPRRGEAPPVYEQSQAPGGGGILAALGALVQFPFKIIGTAFSASTSIAGDSISLPGKVIGAFIAPPAAAEPPPPVRRRQQQY